MFSSLQHATGLLCNELLCDELGLGGSGTVGGAIALALAAILSGVLAAALTLAIVLALAGVLGGIGGRVLGNQEDTGMGGGSGGRGSILLGSLGVEAGGRTAKEASKCGGESEGLCSVGFHEESTFLG